MKKMTIGIEPSIVSQFIGCIKMHDCNPIMADYIGITHIAFEVHDVDKTLDEAIKHGGQLLGQVTEKTVDGVGEQRS